MKKWIVLLLALPLAFRLPAQQKFFEEAIGWRGNHIELHTISDHDKRQNCVFLFNSDSMRLFVLDSTQTVVQHIYAARSFNERLLGGFIKDGKVYAFLHVNWSSPRIHGWTFDIKTGSGEDYYIPFEMKHQQEVEEISCGNRFLYLAVNKKASEFVIYNFRDGKNYDLLTYQFEGGIWKALTTSTEKVDQEGEISPETAGSPNKIYWLHDSLFLLMNNYEKGVTTIFSFDLQSRQVSFRKIIHYNTKELDPAIAYTDNSILFDDKLYFVSALSDSLDLQVRDFHSGQMLHEYGVAGGKEITFKNTPIVQEGSSLHAGSTRQLENTSQLIRKMLNGNAMISVMKIDSGRLALTVGSYAKMSGGGGGIWTGGAPGAAPIFMPTGGFPRNTWAKSARFRMMLDSTTQEFLPGDMHPDVTDRIEQFTKGISIPDQGENLFVNKKRYVYAYYNRDERKIILLNF